MPRLLDLSIFSNVRNPSFGEGILYSRFGTSTSPFRSLLRKWNKQVLRGRAAMLRRGRGTRQSSGMIQPIKQEKCAFLLLNKTLARSRVPQFVEVQVAKPQLSLPALPDANFGSHRRRASTHLCAPSPAAYNSQKPANSRPTSTSIFAIQSVFPNPLSALYPQPSNNLNPIPIGPPRPSQTPATSFNRLYRKSRHWPRFAPDSSSAGPAIKYCSQQLTR